MARATSLTAVVRIVATLPTTWLAAVTPSWSASLRISALLSRSFLGPVGMSSVSQGVAGAFNQAASVCGCSVPCSGASFLAPGSANRQIFFATLNSCLCSGPVL